MNNIIECNICEWYITCKEEDWLRMALPEQWEEYFLVWTIEQCINFVKSSNDLLFEDELFETEDEENMYENWYITK